MADSQNTKESNSAKDAEKQNLHILHNKGNLQGKNKETSVRNLQGK
jgi:hypothetical protein